MLYTYLLHEQLVCRLESRVRLENPYSLKVPVSDVVIMCFIEKQQEVGGRNLRVMQVNLQNLQH